MRARKRRLEVLLQEDTSIEVVAAVRAEGRANAPPALRARNANELASE
jgi:hypothetical protein